MRFSTKITSGIILIFMIVIGCLTFFGNHGEAEFPEVNSDSLYSGEFGSGLMKYTADCFAGRDILNGIGAEINARIGEPVVNGVYVSDERLLAVGSSDTGNMEKSAENVNRFAETYDGAVYFAAVPTSTGIYGDILPSYMIASSEKQQADVLYSLLSTDIRRIDAYSILKMLSDNYIYYKSDTKWTSYGAYCVYRTVIQKLGFMPVPYDRYTVCHVTDEYFGNLSSQTGFTGEMSDILDIYECEDGADITECIGYDELGIKTKTHIYETEKVETEDKYELYFGDPKPLVKIKTNINNNRKLLVIGDEFANCFIPFLTEHYSEIAFISVNSTDKSIDELIDTNEYEQTLFLLGMDSLSKNILEKI